MEKGKSVPNYPALLYAILTEPRDTIFGRYIQMGVRKYISYIHLNSMVIGGH